MCQHADIGYPILEHYSDTGAQWQACTVCRAAVHTLSQPHLTSHCIFAGALEGRKENYQNYIGLIFKTHAHGITEWDRHKNYALKWSSTQFQYFLRIFSCLLGSVFPPRWESPPGTLVSFPGDQARLVGIYLQAWREYSDHPRYPTSSAIFWHKISSLKHHFHLSATRCCSKNNIYLI